MFNFHFSNQTGELSWKIWGEMNALKSRGDTHQSCQCLANVIFGGKSRKTKYIYIYIWLHLVMRDPLWYRYCMLKGTGQAFPRTVSQLYRALLKLNSWFAFPSRFPGMTMRKPQSQQRTPVLLKPPLDTWPSHKMGSWAWATTSIWIPERGNVRIHWSGSNRPIRSSQQEGLLALLNPPQEAEGILFVVSNLSWLQ